MTDYWFKPKSHGYGATPSNWKGWAATGVFTLLVAVLTWVMLVAPALGGNAPSAGDFAIWFAVDFALIVGFVWLTKVKTEGEWRWRWGGKQ